MLACEANGCRAEHLRYHKGCLADEELERCAGCVQAKRYPKEESSDYDTGNELDTDYDTEDMENN